MAQQLLYYKTLIPDTLLAHTDPHVRRQGTNSTELKVGTDAREYEGIINVELLQPGILRNDDDITVVINVAAEGPPPSTYEPLSVCITDHEEVVGIQLIETHLSM